MNLNTQKNIELCRKALFTKQLQYYSKLCELYATLAHMQRGFISPEDVQKKYTSALASAAKGDLDFTSPKNNYVFSDDFKGKKFSDTEIDIFNQYAFAADRLRQFQMATNILSQAVTQDTNGDISINKSIVNKYRDYMQSTSKSTRLFDKHIEDHSRQGIGHNSFLAARKSINTINGIDSDHLPVSKFIKDLTPVAFGSTLSYINPHKQVMDIANNLFTRKERQEFKEEPSPVKEFAHRLGQKAEKKYTANKAKVRQVMVGAACIALLLGGASHINDANTFKDLNVRTNTEQGYQTHVSQDTINKLTAIRTAIENAENSPSQPTREDLASISDSLDGVIDNIMSDLVTDAFETTNPDCKVTSVETNYDKTVNQGKSSTSVPDPENFCTIQYIDKEGVEKEISVHEFSSFAPLIGGNPIAQSYEDEYKLDHSPKYVDGNKNFIEQGQDVMSKLAEYKTILENAEHLAGTQMVFSGGFLIIDPSLKAVLPEKIEDLEDQKAPVSDTKLASTKDIDDDFGR